MDVDETETDADTSDHPGEDTERMAHATSFHGMAPDMEASNAMDNGKCSLLQNTIAERTDLTRRYRFLEADQMEDVQEAKPQRMRGELPHHHRRGGVNTSGE